MESRTMKIKDRDEYLKLCEDCLEKSGFESSPSDPDYVAENQRKFREYFEDKDWLIDLLFNVYNSENQFKNYAQSCLYLSAYRDKQTQLFESLNNVSYSRNTYVDTLVKNAQYLDFDKFLLSILYTLHVPIDIDELKKDKEFRNSTEMKEQYREIKENMSKEHKKITEYFKSKDHNFSNASYMDVNNTTRIFVHDFYDIIGKKKQNNTINKGLENDEIFTKYMPTVLLPTDFCLTGKNEEFGMALDDCCQYIHNRIIHYFI